MSVVRSSDYILKGEGRQNDNGVVGKSNGFHKALRSYVIGEWARRIYMYV